MKMLVCGQFLVNMSVLLDLPDDWHGTPEDLEKLAEAQIGGLDGLMRKVNTLDEGTAVFELADETVEHGILWTADAEILP